MVREDSNLNSSRLAYSRGERIIYKGVNLRLPDFAAQAVLCKGHLTDFD
jgi:hypothetical protein